MTGEAKFEEIWLDISNVKIADGNKIFVQLRADREPERPRWWEVTNVTGADKLKPVMEALDKKRPVMAKVVGDAKVLKVTDISIQYAETTAAR